MTDEKIALIVEDEKDLSTIFSEALKQANFRTEIIEDGQVALERLEQVVPHVVILDLNLPRVNGQKILAYIRSCEQLSQTRVLIVSADVAAAEVLEDEADLVLLKPVSFLQLRDLAKRLAS
jgi:DNA-binding response OmpR family regulator